jgi:protein dithiol oxidoreductase (disulfide-forming)
VGHGENIVNKFSFGLVVVLFLAVSPAQAVNPFDEMYQYIPTPEKLLDDDIIEVTELFLYSCPHCYRIHPVVTAWQKSVASQTDVELVLMPAVFSENNITPAKAFYAAHDLGRSDLHEAMLQAIHRDNKRINTQAEIKAFFIENGVDEADFNRSYNSFAVDNSVRTANFFTANYRINGVPAIVVNGKYLILSSKVSGFQEMFAVVDYLVEKERALIAAKKAPAEPIEEPTAEPVEEPTAEPIEEPTAEPIEEPTAEPVE